MKSFGLFLIAILFATNHLTAELSIGPKIGYTATRLSIDEDDISSSFKSSFQYGAFARIGGNFYLQPELMLTRKGGFLSYEGTSYQKTLNTIDLALIGGFYIFNGEVANISLQAGPVASIFTDKGVFEIPDVLEKSEVKDLMWALQFGAGLDFLIFTLDVRYELGMSSIYRGDYDIKNSLIQVTLGVKLFSRK